VGRGRRGEPGECGLEQGGLAGAGAAEQTHGIDPTRNELRADAVGIAIVVLEQRALDLHPSGFAVIS